MKFRVKQISDKVFLPQVQISDNTWYLIEKRGHTCYFDSLTAYKFCECSTLHTAKIAIKRFAASPKFHDAMYPIFYTI